ncbi:hypothetical protein GCM10023196_106290 [Actinoallomurus vinaceus]|uniref:Glycosyltransferase n=1 Tax=Actinoallomurus vinaceus TaxID=1080074 RepID=A0ABP8UWR4_9ACTN
MTHPARLARAQRLVREAEGHDLRLVCDPAPEKGPATLRTARAAWAAVEPGATHHLVVTDDTVFGPGFLDHVERAVRRRPHQALVFFTEWGSRTASALRIAALCGRPWTEVVDFYLPDLALVMPAEVARGFDDYAASLPEDTLSDHVLHDHLARAGMTALVSVPNLVDHADVPSLIQHEQMGLRPSACFTPELAAAGVPEGDPLTGLTTVPFFSWWNLQAECFVRDDGTSSEWRKEQLAVVLARRGLTAADDDGDGPFASAVGRLEHLSGLLSRSLLRTLWLTAYGVGLIAAERSSEIDMTSAAARTSLRSLAPGGLRRIIDPQASPQAYELLNAFVESAVRSGVEGRERVSS